jgi:hypothetical protein
MKIQHHNRIDLHGQHKKHEKTLRNAWLTSCQSHENAVFTRPISNPAGCFSMCCGPWFRYVQSTSITMHQCCSVVVGSDRDLFHILKFSNSAVSTLFPEVQSLLSKREKKRPSAEETRQSRHTEGRSLALSSTSKSPGWFWIWYLLKGSQISRLDILGLAGIWLTNSKNMSTLDPIGDNHPDKHVFWPELTKQKAMIWQK